MTNTTNGTNSTDLKSLMNQLDTFLELYLVKKAPSLPVNAKEVIVKYAPYISLIGVLVLLPVFLGALGLSALLAPFAMIGGHYFGSFGLSTIFGLVLLALEALSINGLFARSKTGWNFAYYAALLNIVYVTLDGNIINAIIGSAISLYFLFQVKSYYK